jgi:hypothetical protein
MFGRALFFLLIIALFMLVEQSNAFAQNVSSLAQANKPKKRKKVRRPPARRPAPPSKSTKELLGASGSLRSGYFEKDRAFRDEKSIGLGSIWLTLKPEELYSMRAVLELSAEFGTSPSEPSQYDIREGYLETAFGPIDIRAGRQIIAWGRGDKVNPTDFLSVRNTTRLVIEDEDQRTGQGALQVVGNFGDSRIFLIIQPEWREPKYAISRLPTGVGLSYLKPDTGIIPYAIKFDQMAVGFDFSLSYFSGPDRVPDIEVLSESATLDLGLMFNQIQGYGMDFAFNIGPTGCRGEIAYVSTADKGGSDPLIKNAYFYGVIGADRSFGEFFNLNFQYLFKSIERWRDPADFPVPTEATLARLVNLTSNQIQENIQGAVARVAWKTLSDRLILEAAYVSWFFKGDALFRPKATYSVIDDLKLTIGADLYSGSSDSILGRNSDLSSGYAEVRWSF